MSDEAEALRELARDSCNVVALAPGRVIGYAHNQAANDTLRQAGVEVIETPGVELVRGRGASLRAHPGPGRDTIGLPVVGYGGAGNSGLTNH